MTTRGGPLTFVGTLTDIRVLIKDNLHCVVDNAEVLELQRIIVCGIIVIIMVMSSSFAPCSINDKKKRRKAVARIQ